LYREFELLLLLELLLLVLELNTMVLGSSNLLLVLLNEEADEIASHCVDEYNIEIGKNRTLRTEAKRSKFCKQYKQTKLNKFKFK